jgi:predicted SAM-dependent methyltransferase
MSIDAALLKLVRRGGRRARAELDEALVAARNARLRRRVDGVEKVHVGCGPHNRLEGWHNVDIKAFPSVDTAMDVTKSWPFEGLAYVYSEHFLEHLELLDGVRFLANSGRSMRPGGRIRLSTPNLHWVMLTHFATGAADDATRRSDTFKTNRAFHGWGHRFLYTQATLRWLLESVGYEAITFHAYGESPDPTLVGLERHGGYSVEGGQPSVIIAEATRGARPTALSRDLEQTLRQEYVRFVDAA